MKLTLSLKKNRSRLNDEQQILLSEISGKSREYLIARSKLRPADLLTAPQLRRFKMLSSQLAKGMPLAYLLGYKWFFGRKFLVDRNVLIPRPETETLVEIALAEIKKNKPDIIADIGTGSGAIIATLAAEIRQNNAKFLATDISAQALKIAKKNSKKISKAKINFLKGDLLRPVFKKVQPENSVFVISNLPYLTKKQLSEPSIRKEPRLALYGGRSGIEIIERLLQQISKLNAKQITILLETNYNHSKKIKSLAKKYLPGYKVLIQKDLSGFNRFALIMPA